MKKRKAKRLGRAAKPKSKRAQCKVLSEDYDYHLSMYGRHRRDANYEQMQKTAKKARRLGCKWVRRGRI